MFVLLATNLNSQNIKIPQKGYYGEAGISFGTGFSKTRGSIPIFEIFTTHGYKPTPGLFLGLGINSYNTQYLAVYTQVSGILRKIQQTTSSYPILSFNFGYGASTWIGDNFADEKGIYIEPKFSWSFYSKNANIRYNVFTSANIFNLRFIPKIGLAFEF